MTLEELVQDWRNLAKHFKSKAEELNIKHHPIHAAEYYTKHDMLEMCIRDVETKILNRSPYDVYIGVG